MIYARKTFSDTLKMIKKFQPAAITAPQTECYIHIYAIDPSNRFYILKSYSKKIPPAHLRPSSTEALHLPNAYHC